MKDTHYFHVMQVCSMPNLSIFLLQLQESFQTNWLLILAKWGISIPGFCHLLPVFSFHVTFFLYSLQLRKAEDISIVYVLGALFEKKTPISVVDYICEIFEKYLHLFSVVKMEKHQFRISNFLAKFIDFLKKLF